MPQGPIPTSREPEPFFLGRRRENRENQQTGASRVANSMWNALGGNQHHAGGHRQLSVFQRKDAFAFQHLVDLVHAFMGVELVFLIGLKGVQTDEDAVGREERALAHFF